MHATPATPACSGGFLTSSLDSSQPMKWSTIKDGSGCEGVAVACHLLHRSIENEREKGVL